jgi:transcriptional/translational regulatory protein YebC/TACO1
VLNRVFEEQSDLETLARQAAEDAIEEAALEDGILDIANTNAESYMRAFLMAMGFDQVFFALPGGTDAPTVTPTPG